MTTFDPMASYANLRHEFGEHGGVNMSVSTSSEMPDEELIKADIAPGLVRISIGYTGTLEQRWTQMQSALEKLGPNGRVDPGASSVS